MKYLPIVAVCFVSSCGASTHNHVTYQTPAPDEPYRAINELTLLDEVPLVGEARYSGEIGFGTNDVDTIDDARVVGDLTLDVDFHSDRISGTADRFVDRLTGEHLAGDLESDLRIYRDAEETASDAVAGFTDGTLYRPNGRVVDVELDTFGDFLGTSGRRIAGTVEGEVTGLAVSPTDDVTGVFDVRK